MRNKVFNTIVITALMVLAVACNKGDGKNQAAVNNAPAPQSGQVQAPAQAPVYADDDHVVQANNLPQNAQDYVNEYFSGKTIANVIADSDDYNVILQTGERLEFDMSGEIKEIECYPEVPANVIDNRILNDVRSIDPRAKIVKIERKYGGYEVKLNTGLEINYDPGFQRMGYDD